MAKNSKVSKKAIKRRMGSEPVDKPSSPRVNSTLDQLAVMSAMRNSDGAKFR